jgi:hypothetical protein
MTLFLLTALCYSLKGEPQKCSKPKLAPVDVPTIQVCASGQDDIKQQLRQKFYAEAEKQHQQVVEFNVEMMCLTANQALSLVPASPK